MATAIEGVIEEIAIRGLAGMSVSEAFDMMRADVESFDFQYFMNDVLLCDSFELYVDSQRQKYNTCFPRVNIIADSSIGGIGALPQAIIRQPFPLSELDGSMVKSIDELVAMVEKFSRQQASLQQRQDALEFEVSPLRAALRLKENEDSKSVEVTATENTQPANAIHVDILSPPVPTATASTCFIKPEPEAATTQFQSVLVLVVPQTIRTSILFEGEAFASALPLHHALVNFVSWAGSAGVSLLTIQQCFDTRQPAQVQRELDYLDASGVLFKMVIWSSTEARPRNTNQVRFCLQRYYKNNSIVESDGEDGTTNKDKDSQHSSSENDTNADSNENPNTVSLFDEAKRSSWHCSPDGTTRVIYKHFSAKQLCEELERQDNKTITSDKLMFNLSRQKSMWNYRQLVTELENRKIVELVTNKQENGKQRIYVRLLQSYWEYPFDHAIFNKSTIQAKIKSMCITRGERGFTLSDVETMFCASRRSTRKILINMTNAGLLSCCDGTHQSAWEGNTHFCDVAFMDADVAKNQTLTTIVSHKKTTARREKLLAKLVREYGALAIDRNTRRLLHRAEMDEVGNDMPKEADKKVLERLVKTLESNKTITTAQITIKPNQDDPSSFFQKTYMLAAGIHEDGPELKGVVQEIINAIHEKAAAERLEEDRKRKPKPKIKTSRDNNSTLRSPKRRRVSPGLPWEAENLEHRILGILWLTEREENFESAILHSIDDLRHQHSAEEIEDFLTQINVLGWTARFKKGSTDLSKSWRLSESFRRHATLKISASTVSSARQQLAHMIHSARLVTPDVHCVQSTSAAALHGLGYGVLSATVHLSDKLVQEDALQDTSKQNDDGITQSCASSAVAYLSVNDPDSLTTEGTRQFFAERLLSVSLFGSSMESEKHVDYVDDDIKSTSEAILNVVQEAGTAGITEVKILESLIAKETLFRTVGEAIDDFCDCLHVLLIECKLTCFSDKEIRYILPSVVSEAYGNEDRQSECDDLPRHMVLLWPWIVRSWSIADGGSNTELVKLLRSQIVQKVFVNPGITEEELAIRMRYMTTSSNLRLVLADLIERKILRRRASIGNKCLNIYGDMKVCINASLYCGSKGLLS